MFSGELICLYVSSFTAAVIKGLTALPKVFLCKNTCNTHLIPPVMFEEHRMNLCCLLLVPSDFLHTIRTQTAGKWKHTFICIWWSCVNFKHFFLSKVKRSRVSRGWIPLVSRMIKSLQNPPALVETSGSAAANQTSSPANQEEKSMSRTRITTLPSINAPPKPTKSTRSPPERTCAEGRSSSSTCRANRSSHWCSTSTLLRGAPSVTSRLLMEQEEPGRRSRTVGSSFQGDSVTLYRCLHSCLALRSLTWLLLWAPTTTALSPVTPRRCQVSWRGRTSP